MQMRKIISEIELTTEEIFLLTNIQILSNTKVPQLINYRNRLIFSFSRYLENKYKELYITRWQKIIQFLSFSSDLKAYESYKKNMSYFENIYKTPLIKLINGIGDKQDNFKKLLNSNILS